MIILGKQHQHTFRNDTHVELSFVPSRLLTLFAFKQLRRKCYPRLADGCITFKELHLSICSSNYQICEYDILKTNEPILYQNWHKSSVRKGH